ncbi:MAG TPA: hypothetical protein VG986_18105 [Pseudolabrys sp.]|nr:hypothetical protein [Pseudolabrys sp.]
MLRSTLVSCAFAAACLLSVAAGAEPVVPNAPDMVKYSFLGHSQWYVPAETLPAVEMNLATGKVFGVVDQTVWDITGYRYGYFWGRTAAVFTRQVGGKPQASLSCATMLGSVTSDGQVYITFVPKGQKTALAAVRGIGSLKPTAHDWRFQMQMSTGTTTLIAHGSYMAQCRAGQACETKLPGSDLSLKQFLAQCD